MNQQQLDDNGMVFNTPIKIVFKDIETGLMKSEEVEYSKGCDVMRGKSNKSDMVNLPVAGWIKSSSIQKFASVYKKKEVTGNTDTSWKAPKPMLEKSLKELKEFLEFELARVREKIKLTGFHDPRTRVYARLLELNTREGVVNGLRKFWSAEDKI